MTTPIPTPDTLQLATTGRREQPYRQIHKALRALLAEALQRVGTCDVRDDVERAAMVDTVERALSVCCDHLAHENRFFHEPLRQRAPRAVLAFENDHVEHLQAIGALRLQLQRVRDAGVDGEALSYALYLQFGQFVGENLLHMAEEETVLTLALWEHFSDAEIQALEAALRATLSPEESAFYLQWMARGLNPAELEALLLGARAGMPPEAFEPLSAMALAEQSEPRRARLAQALGQRNTGVAA